jgi:uncharacterized protein
MSLQVPISALIHSLQAREPRETVRLIETHISWVLVTPTTAYKIKKPVRFSFVDFRTPALRKLFCEEEVRLNQRLAPEIYQAIVPITYSRANDRWTIDSALPVKPEEIVDWAVKMRAFNADATLDHASEILPTQIDAIADKISHFHEQETPLPQITAFGSANEISRLAIENLEELKAQFPQDQRIAKISDWTLKKLKELDSFFDQRKRDGLIRQCHGDLHLGNIAWEHDEPIIFDCIEFNDSLRCIDLINEIAFLFMDLNAKGHPALAWRFLNRWLEHTGDYQGLPGLMFYATYRALVRAKISMHQGKAADAKRYLALAERFIIRQKPTLTLMHGFSGSGKTVESQRLLETEGAIRIRSDVERKRLHSLKSASSSDSALGGGIYQESVNAMTFDRLQRLAQELLASGFHVIVDATFLKHTLRQEFISLGQSLHVPVRIVDMAVPPIVCRQRILSRITTQNDASEATLEVLEHQLQTADPLTPEELAFAKVLGTVPGA